MADIKVYNAIAEQVNELSDFQLKVLKSHIQNIQVARSKSLIELEVEKMNACVQELGKLNCTIGVEYDNMVFTDFYYNDILCQVIATYETI